MNTEDVLKSASMPFNAPSYPKGPYRFINREYFIVVYRSNPEAIARHVPEPLMPDGSDLVFFEFIRMPDSYGFGKYVESGVVIPCTYNGEAVNFTSQMYLDCLSPIVAGREIWGFPKKLGSPTLKVVHDTLVGTLLYGDRRVALGTMQYKYIDLLSSDYEKAPNPESIVKKLSKTQVNLKLIPGADGELEIAQLIAYNLTNLNVKGAWAGEARLHLVPHAQAPLADLPVLEVKEGLHFIADLTLPYGRILHDYLKK